MARTDGRPSGQSWGTFLRNHLPQMAAIDLFVVPTIGFNLLYVLVIVRLARRELVWISVTAYPTAEWIAQQITEAFPWNEVPRYLIRDRDGIYGVAVTRRLRAMGIRDKPISAGSPWQNSFAERWHAAAAFYLQHHPGDYETVRRLLGHRSSLNRLMADLRARGIVTKVRSLKRNPIHPRPARPARTSWQAQAPDTGALQRQ